MTEDEWIEAHKPIAHSWSDEGFDFGEGCTLLNWYDARDVKVLDAADPMCIWTVVEGGDAMSVIAGRHVVNRFGHIITAVPWSDPLTEIEIDTATDD